MPDTKGKQQKQDVLDKVTIGFTDGRGCASGIGLFFTIDTCARRFEFWKIFELWKILGIGNPKRTQSEGDNIQKEI